MTTLTANQTQVLVALATNTTIETQPWVTTAIIVTGKQIGRAHV